MQRSARLAVSTPVNWKSGEDVIIAGSVTAVDERVISDLTSATQSARDALGR